jgi:hypothetical protein
MESPSQQEGGKQYRWVRKTLAPYYLPSIIVLWDAMIYFIFPAWESFLCSVSDSIIAATAHKCVNQPVSQLFGERCFVVKGFDFLAEHTFHSHNRSHLLLKLMKNHVPILTHSSLFDMIIGESQKSAAPKKAWIFLSKLSGAAIA